VSTRGLFKPLQRAATTLAAADHKGGEESSEPATMIRRLSRGADETSQWFVVVQAAFTVAGSERQSRRRLRNARCSIARGRVIDRTRVPGDDDHTKP